MDAEDLQLTTLFEEALDAFATQEERRQLRLFLQILSSPLVNGLLAGHWRAFEKLSIEAQTAVLQSWMRSRIGLRRRAFQAVKRLALFLSYSAMPAGDDNPSWQGIGYQPAPKPSNTAPRRLLRNGSTSTEDLHAEVLVVGSGAGGAVVAAELAAAGHDVLVVEKGGHFEAADFHGWELAANAELFEKRGALATADLGVVVLAGSTLGGGTVVNWSTSLETPAIVREEWARDYGFVGVDGAEYEESLRAVQARLRVNREQSQPNQQNQILARGAKRVGLGTKVVPRNATGCIDCSYCTFGCRHGAKQSMLRTYLPEAEERGARILTGAYVEKVLIEGGRAVGAVVEIQNGGSAVPQRRQIRAGAVVVCAGAIHTPALLRRSGLRNPNVGRHLRLHPVTAPFGLYDEPVLSWQGPPQTRMVDARSDLDGQGYGVRLEVAPAHPGLWASALPWTSGLHHKRLMGQLDHLANIIVICRDRGSGQVSVGSAGQPVLQYRLDPYDAEHLLAGTLEALRMHRAAGAEKILSPHAEPVVCRPQRDSFADFVHEVRVRGLGTNHVALFSAHQMGSCRVAGWRRRGAVRPDGESWEVRDLFVADGSIFPTACGVNPMIPIAATAHFLSGRIESRL